MNEVVYVGTTHNGQSVIAAVPFDADTIVGYVRGQLIADAEYGSDYCMDIGEGKGLEPSDPFRRMNHSCNPNCELVVYDEEIDVETGGPLMAVTSIRSIQPGEEITIDYAWAAEYSIPCRCLSINCRGWIVAEEQLTLLREMQTHGPVVRPPQL